jgi:type II secretory pathway component PulC
MKKFKFNFDFLDRFKKKAAPPEEEKFDDSDLDESETPTEENADDSAHQEITESKDIDSSVQKSEYDSDISPEEFAEKSLGGFDLNQVNSDLGITFKEALSPTSEVASTEQTVAPMIDESNEQILGEEIHPEDVDNFSQDEVTPFDYRQAEPPVKPETPKKFNFRFNFPKFNSLKKDGSAKESIKFDFQTLFSKFDKFSWNDFVSKLFSPYSRGRIHSVFVILLLITITYLLGKNLALFFNRSNEVAKFNKSIVLPQEKPNTTLQDINKIALTNLFNANETDKAGPVKPKVDIDSIVCTEAEKPASNDFKLFYTMVFQNSIKSVASFQVRGDTELKNVREGDRLNDQVEISKISRLRVVLKNLQTGDCEYAVAETESDRTSPQIKIMSPKAGKSLFKSMNPNIKNVGNNFKIKKTFRDSMITNMSEVLTQAKALQITNPDGSLCFKMTEIVPGSIYSQLNIQENDIVCNINGKKIDNLNELMGLLGKIKEIDQFQIGLKRNGMSENLEYNFE